MSEHYVYTLAYPKSMGGSVSYVGKGMGERIHHHETVARTGYRAWNEQKITTIRDIWANGEQVVKKKVAFFETNEEACLYEIALIFFLPNLTNLSSGGEAARWGNYDERMERLYDFVQAYPHASIMDIAKFLGRSRTFAHKELSAMRRLKGLDTQGTYVEWSLVEQVQAILQETPDASVRDVAHAIGRSKSTAHKAIKAVKQQKE